MDKSYCKICSGNGVQLLIKLDFPIRMPFPEYELKGERYEKKYNIEFEKIRNKFTKGLRRQITGFSNYKLKQKLACNVDGNAFKLSQISALPYTKNFKFDSFRWRGIIELQDKEKNEGLADYILAIKLEYLDENNIMGRKRKEISADNRLMIHNIYQHRLVKLMLENDLPHGKLNNTLWCQMKCVIRDSEINIKHPKFIEFHKELEAKYNDKFTLNMPKEDIQFSETVINNYCIENKIPLIYDYMPRKCKPNLLKLEDFVLDITLKKPMMRFDFAGENILEKMQSAKSQMKTGKGNGKILDSLLYQIQEHYGKDIVFYLWEQKVIQKFFNYD
jgi:hypothetical protein